jgi:uncharacterized membrane protein (DUF106 family)
MNRTIYISFILLFALIIISCVFSENNYKETFVPKIVKETYRPLERNIRRTYEGFYNKTSTGVSNFFRKFGIL